MTMVWHARRNAATGSTTIDRRQVLVERWARRRLGGIDHERRVCDIATGLFRLTRPLHALTGADLRLLRLAAIVHDVGRCVGEAGHERTGAGMILDEAALPVSPADRRALAFLTRYHKGRVPAPGEERILTDADDRDRLRLLLAMLRAADALDCRSLASPRLVFALRGRRSLEVTCYLHEDSPKARKTYRRRKKFLLLEELLGVRVQVNVLYAEALSMVA